MHNPSPPPLHSVFLKCMLNVQLSRADIDSRSVDKVWARAVMMAEVDHKSGHAASLLLAGSVAGRERGSCKDWCATGIWHVESQESLLGHTKLSLIAVLVLAWRQNKGVYLHCILLAPLQTELSVTLSALVLGARASDSHC